jgi:hypothetical protein
VTQAALLKTIMTSVDALAAFTEPKMTSGTKATMEADWFEVGKAPNLVALTFRTKVGGSPNVRDEQTNGGTAVRTLAVVAELAPIPPTPQNAQN